MMFELATILLTVFFFAKQRSKTPVSHLKERPHTFDQSVWGTQQTKDVENNKSYLRFSGGVFVYFERVANQIILTTQRSMSLT